MKIKVLQVIATLEIGGAENVAMNIYRYIDRSKFEFHYLVYGDTIGTYEKEVIQLGGKVIHIPYPDLTRYAFKQNFIEAVRKNGMYQIIHSHLLFHNGIILTLASRLGIPIRISHSHTTKHYSETNLVRHLMLKVYQNMSRKQIQKYATSYLACGEDAGLYLYGAKLFKAKGIVIKNGVDLNKFSYNASIRDKKRTMFSVQNKWVYANIGHFQPVKNHTFLVDIFHEISKIQSDAVLWLIGEGYLKDTIQNKVKSLGLENKVLFTGNVSNISEILQVIDTVIMPSLFEGLPLSLIEAQAAGIQCYVSDTITKEADVTGLLNYISLTKSAQYWARSITERRIYTRVSMNRCVEEKGYNINKNMKTIEAIYLHGSNQRGGV